MQSFKKFIVLLIFVFHLTLSDNARIKNVIFFGYWCTAHFIYWLTSIGLWLRDDPFNCYHWFGTVVQYNYKKYGFWWKHGPLKIPRIMCTIRSWKNNEKLYAHSTRTYTPQKTTRSRSVWLIFVGQSFRNCVLGSGQQFIGKF